METAVKKTTSAATAAQPAAEVVAKTAPPLSTSTPSQIQTATRVSSPEDAEEKEAESTAQHVMRMSVSDSRIASVNTPSGRVYREVFRSPYIARFAHIDALNRQPTREEERTEEVQRQAEEEDQEEEIQRQAEGKTRKRKSNARSVKKRGRRGPAPGQ